MSWVGSGHETTGDPVYQLLFSTLLHSKLMQLGWTQQQVTQRVKEKAVSESESIYGTLYGTLGDSDRWVWLCGCGFVGVAF